MLRTLTRNFVSLFIVLTPSLTWAGVTINPFTGKPDIKGSAGTVVVSTNSPADGQFINYISSAGKLATTPGVSYAPSGHATYGNEVQVKDVYFSFLSSDTSAATGTEGRIYTDPDTGEFVLNQIDGKPITALNGVFNAAVSTFGITTISNRLSGSPSSGGASGPLNLTTLDGAGGPAGSINLSAGGGGGDVGGSINIRGGSAGCAGNCAAGVINIDGGTGGNVPIGTVNISTTNKGKVVIGASTITINGAQYIFPSSTESTSGFLNNNGATPAKLSWSAAGTGTSTGPITNVRSAFGLNNLVTGTTTTLSVNTTIYGVVSVSSFGAYGDGVTDVTTNIQNAIDAATAACAGVVYFPHGQYIITSTLTLPTSNICLGWDGFPSPPAIIGEHQADTYIIQTDATRSAFYLGQTPTGQRFEHISIVNSHANTVSATGILTVDGAFFLRNYYNDIYLRGWKTAINMTSGQDSVISNSWLNENNIGLLFTNGNSNITINNVIISNQDLGPKGSVGQIVGVSTGIWIQSTGQFKINGLDMGNMPMNTGIGISDSGAPMITLVGANLEISSSSIAGRGTCGIDMTGAGFASVIVNTSRFLGVASSSMDYPVCGGSFNGSEVSFNNSQYGGYITAGVKITNPAGTKFFSDGDIFTTAHYVQNGIVQSTITLQPIHPEFQTNSETATNSTHGKLKLNFLLGGGTDDQVNFVSQRYDGTYGWDNLNQYNSDDRRGDVLHLTGRIQVSTQGTSSFASQFFDASHSSTQAFDGSLATWWWSNTNILNDQSVWITIDLGVGNAIAIDRMRLAHHDPTTGVSLQGYYAGSNNLTSWTTLGSTFTHASVDTYYDTNFFNTTPYRYYRIYFTGSPGQWAGIEEWQLYKDGINVALPIITTDTVTASTITATKALIAQSSFTVGGPLLSTSSFHFTSSGTIDGTVSIGTVSAQVGNFSSFVNTASGSVTNRWDADYLRARTNVEVSNAVSYFNVDIVNFGINSLNDSGFAIMDSDGSGTNGRQHRMSSLVISPTQTGSRLGGFDNTGAAFASVGSTFTWVQETSDTVTGALLIPNGTNPTTDRAGQISLDTTASQLILSNASTATAVAQTTHTMVASIPSQIGYFGSTVSVFGAPPNAAITITSIDAASLPTGTTVQYKLDYRSYGSEANIGTQIFNTGFSTANATGVTTTGFNSTLVPANAAIYMVFPDTDVTKGSPINLRTRVNYTIQRQ